MKHDIQHSLQIRVLTPILQAHLRKKIKWSSATIDHIDWEVHSKGRSILYHYKYKEKATQSMHRCLPTHSHPGSSRPGDMTRISDTLISVCMKSRK